MQRLRNGGIKDLETLNAELDKWGGDKLLSTGAHLLEVFIEANFTGCIGEQLFYLCSNIDLLDYARQLYIPWNTFLAGFWAVVHAY